MLQSLNILMRIEVIQTPVVTPSHAKVDFTLSIVDIFTSIDKYVGFCTQTRYYLNFSYVILFIFQANTK